MNARTVVHSPAEARGYMKYHNDHTLVADGELPSYMLNKYDVLCNAHRPSDPDPVQRAPHSRMGLVEKLRNPPVTSARDDAARDVQHAQYREDAPVNGNDWRADASAKSRDAYKASFGDGSTATVGRARDPRADAYAASWGATQELPAKCGDKRADASAASFAQGIAR